MVRSAAVALLLSLVAAFYLFIFFFIEATTIG
jgi:hypothetical protein